MDLSQQWSYILQVSETRLANNQTERHVTEYGPSIEVIGAAGELAARHFLQISEELHTHFDSGADIIWKDMRVDVKATVWTPKLSHRFLQWPIWKEIKADVILLTAINMEKKSAIVVGYAFPEDILNAPINRTRFIPCHEIPVPKLRKASQLLFVESKDALRPKAKTKKETSHRQPGYQASART